MHSQVFLINLSDAVSDLLTKLNLESDGAEIKIALEQILQNLTADGKSKM